MFPLRQILTLLNSQMLLGRLPFLGKNELQAQYTLKAEKLNKGTFERTKKVLKNY